MTEENLSQKLFMQKDGKKFVYKEDIKKSIKKLKEEYLEEFRMSEKTKKNFIKKIKEIFGKELVE